MKLDNALADRVNILTAVVRGVALAVVLLACLVAQCVSQQMAWVNVGFLTILAAIWTPHAYFRFITHRDSHSVFQNKKKIESLTTSLNLLSVKLQEVEKASKHVAFAQGFAESKKRFSL